MKEENRQINIEHGISVVINTYNASQHLAEVSGNRKRLR